MEYMELWSMKHMEIHGHILNSYNCTGNIYIYTLYGNIGDPIVISYSIIWEIDGKKICYNKGNT